MKKSQSQYEKFDAFMRALMRTPHTAIKAQLAKEAEEKAKRKSKRTSALGREHREQD